MKLALIMAVTYIFSGVTFDGKAQTFRLTLPDHIKPTEVIEIPHSSFEWCVPCDPKHPVMYFSLERIGNKWVHQIQFNDISNVSYAYFFDNNAFERNGVALTFPIETKTENEATLLVIEAK